MKLGYLISQYPAVNHTFVLREVLELRKIGFDVRVVSIRRRDRPRLLMSEEESAEDLRTFSVMGSGIASALVSQVRALLRHPVGYPRGLLFAWMLSQGSPKLLYLYTMYFFEAVIAGEYFESQGVSLIHTHFSSTVLLILSRIYRLPYSLTVHGPDEFNDPVGFHMATKVAGATFVSTISHYGSSQVFRASDPHYWSKVLVLRLGVDPAVFVPRPRLAMPTAAPFKLVFVGRLVPAKAPLVLIEALDLLRRQGRSVHLTLVGEGPCRARLEALIRSRNLGSEALLVGACNHDRIVSFYRESDAFVLASFAEGIPVALMEAMATELPCVSTWIAGIPELIENEIDGLLVRPASPEAIANAVGRLIDDPEFASRLGVAARRKILAEYNITGSAQRLGIVFRQYLDTGHQLQ